MTAILKADYEKAYRDGDIRGVYPTQIDEAVAYYTARAFVEEYKFKKIVVGYDMRLSTPSLSQAFIDGARDSGASVVNVGLVSSPMLYFASGSMNLPGAMITASHSAKDFNGIKPVLAGAIPLTRTSGLGALLKRVKKGEFVDAKKRGGLTKKDVAKGYQKFVLKGLDKKGLEGIKVLADTGNGMAGVVMPLLEEKLPVKFEMLYGKLDGNFPNRDSDPCLRKNQKGLVEKLTKKKYDFGIGFDGDADRIAFLDEKGDYVNCASIGALVSKLLLEKEPKSKIVFTNLTSNVLEETIKEYGGKPVRSRVGHAFLKRKMRETGAIYGAEHSGHFFFRDFYGTDSVTLTLLCVLEAYKEAKAQGQTFSQMMKPYLRYEQTEDVVVEVEDKQAVLDKMHKYLQKMNPKKITKFDGYFVDFGDVWGSVKPSVTEQAIKLMFESKTKAKATKVQKELLKYLKEVAKR